jgi:hypothetical protein
VNHCKVWFIRHAVEFFTSAQDLYNVCIMILDCSLEEGLNHTKANQRMTTALQGDMRDASFWQ